MANKIILGGGVPLIVTDPSVPFALVEDEFRTGGTVFCHLREGYREGEVPIRPARLAQPDRSVRTQG